MTFPATTLYHLFVWLRLSLAVYQTNPAGQLQPLWSLSLATPMLSRKLFNLLALMIKLSMETVARSIVKKMDFFQILHLNAKIFAMIPLLYHSLDPSSKWTNTLSIR